jgi:hypothetical protein
MSRAHRNVPSNPKRSIPKSFEVETADAMAASEATAILARALREDLIPGTSFDISVGGDAIVTHHPNEHDGEYRAQRAFDPVTGSHCVIFSGAAGEVVFAGVRRQ